MDIKELRVKIDEIDEGITELFLKRMSVSAEIAKYKRGNNLPVYDPVRELQKLGDIEQRADEHMREYVAELYKKLFELSRRYQERV